METPRQLALLAGNPQDSLRFIHVAGTNGKGSTCAMLESIFRAAGWRVGLFTSPHLVSFAERLQVNRKVIFPGHLARLVSDLQPLLKEFPADTPPTLFEVATVLALQYFAVQKCDIVIWETGLGGRLDATNIVTPLASVITNIGWDHQQWLGDSLDKIAAEKAGILKPGVPAITAATPGHGLEVIIETARLLGTPLTRVGPGCSGDEVNSADPLAAIWPGNRRQIPALPLPGAHQRLNAAVAVATVQAVSAQIKVDDHAIVDGLLTVDWPGRLQVVKSVPGRTIVLDGAHNSEGARALRAAFDELFPKARPTLILGVLADKDWRPIVDALAPLAGRIVLTPVSSRRTLEPSAMRAACTTVSPSVNVVVCATLEEALRNAAADPLLLIAGSLYLVGEAMQLLGLTPKLAADELALNEWIRPQPAAP
ncbi:MAG: dihydrofolate synthase / folylpolyglutamate synthase [Verrucomicrobiota bacterium]